MALFVFEYPRPYLLRRCGSDTSHVTFGPPRPPLVRGWQLVVVMETMDKAVAVQLKNGEVALLQI